VLTSEHVVQNDTCCNIHAGSFAFNYQTDVVQEVLSSDWVQLLCFARTVEAAGAPNMGLKKLAFRRLRVQESARVKAAPAQEVLMPKYIRAGPVNFCVMKDGELSQGPHELGCIVLRPGCRAPPVYLTLVLLQWKVAQQFKTV
jgi:hypothetical protein